MVRGVVRGGVVRGVVRGMKGRRLCTTTTTTTIKGVRRALFS